MGSIGNLRRAAKRDKAIADPFLNRLGLQVWRTVAARVVRSARRRPAVPAHLREPLAELEREGCIAIADFLGPSELAAAQRVAVEALGSSDVARDLLRDGANEVEVIWRCDLAEPARAVLDRLFCHPDLLALVGAVERIEPDPGAGRCTLQRLRQRDGDADEQADVHCDTFHPTHKVWLYLTDVAPSDGLLVYYPRSHRLDRHLLAGVYAESNGPNEGSRRVGSAEIARRGLDRREFEVPANTLVIADTGGYHGRTQGWTPGSRIALQIEVRPDPFRRSRRMGEDRSRAQAVP